MNRTRGRVVARRRYETLDWTHVNDEYVVHDIHRRGKILSNT